MKSCLSVFQFYNGFEIMHRTWQYRCCVLCKISEWLGNCKISYAQTRFCKIWVLTPWGKLTIIDSNNGLSPEWRQVIIWINAEILLIGPLGTNVSEILIGIQTFSLKKICLNMSSAKFCPFLLSLSVLRCFSDGYCIRPLDLRLTPVLFDSCLFVSPGTQTWRVRITPSTRA